jgi:hypothetical protein
MKKTYLVNLLIVICTVTFMGSCDDMNDKQKPYFENGEIVYIGKIDSLKVFSGDERVKFRYRVSDPRAKSLTVSWSLGKDSLVIPIPAHNPVDSFEITIGKNAKTIVEGTHTFNFVVWGEYKDKSVVVEANAKVYGQKYQSQLINRPLIGAEANGNNVTVNWSGAFNNQESGIEVSYTNTSGEKMTESYESSEVSSIVFHDVELTEPMTYQTFYLPEPTAIDTFVTAPQKISVRGLVNVSLQKPVTHSDQNNATQGGAYAVDGVITDQSRWVGNASNLDHWIEIDLQGTYTINAFRTWRTFVNDSKFRLQVNVGGEWVTVVSEDNNTAATNATIIYYKEFDSISTDKVRYFVPAHSPVADNRPRLWEIEVYSVVYY